MAAPPGGDLAAQLYLALSAGGEAEAVAAILDVADPRRGGDAEAMRRVSEWEERRPPDADRPAPGGREAYITRGLTALHVLARDSADVAAVGRAIDLAGPEALATAGGFRKGIGGQPAARLPIHYAARDNSSPEWCISCLIRVAWSSCRPRTRKAGSRSTTLLSTTRAPRWCRPS